MEVKGCQEYKLYTIYFFFLWLAKPLNVSCVVRNIYKIKTNWDNEINRQEKMTNRKNLHFSYVKIFIKTMINVNVIYSAYIDI